MERESDMSAKYTVTESFKSTEKDRKISFLNKMAKIISTSVKYPADKNERWKRT
jgi:hypothetical protein